MARRLVSTALIAFGASIVIGPALLVGGDMGSYRRSEVVTSGETGRPETIIPSKQEEETVRRTAEALDDLRKKVEEWGAVTISAPVAVLDSSAFFVPSDIAAAKQLYTDAANDINASAIQSLERGVSNQLGVVATPIPIPIPQLAKPASGGTTTSTVGTSTTTTSPAVPPIVDSTGKPRPSLDTTTGTDVPQASFGAFSSEKAAAPFALQTTPTAVVKSISARLREAEDNAIKQKIYSEMSRPTEIKKHNHVIFAIVQVSCNPGWRTQQKYIADCSASVEYYDMITQMHYPREYQKAPTVFSVLPLMDAQTVEMANSQREVTQLAFQLAGSLPAKGVDIKAKDIFNFVRRYSRDLKSVTPIPVVNSYSTGKTFGFRFSPSFQALRDPAQKNSRAANVLLPTTFPALITVIIHEADLRAYGEWYRAKHPEWLPAEPDDDEEKLPPGIALLTHISTRWYLKERPPLWQFPKRLFTPMKRDTPASEVYAAKNVAIMNNLKKEFGESTFPNPNTRVGTFNPVYDELHREVIDLQSKGVGQSWPVSLDDAFLNEKKKVDAKMRARLEQNERIEDLQKQDLEKQFNETEVAKANTISISVTDAKGTVKRIAFDKRPFGNLSGDQLIAIVKLFTGADASPDNSPSPATAKEETPNNKGQKVKDSPPTAPIAATSSPIPTPTPTKNPTQ